MTTSQQAESLTTTALYRIAQARSGDKGDTADISVFLPTRELWAYLDEQLSAEHVAAFLSPLVRGRVVRYEMPVLYGYKFVCQDALGGGGSSSLRGDNLGKSMGSALLRMTISAPADLVAQSPLLDGPTQKARS